ncbi:GMC oxidoreductase [Actinomadura rayongensis]|uniref:Cholesterol oxidase n=1 Tax=Actinomadura rayongensis TaxID=1429076 RepID=A0A6I4WGJ7_9ACTN|nr:GMC oxidoreductase [Actinomadura rayongensis]MXQ65732.1 NAD(P)-binding protein [Actinomadura rayongensis]
MPKSEQRPPADREESHRVVIIGAGVGGSVTAFRLARAGIDNVVLERGRRWPITPEGGTFPRFPSLDRRLLWLHGRAPRPPGPRWLARLVEGADGLFRSTGLLDALVTPRYAVVCGAGVGGGTLVYGGMLPQPRAEVFRRVFPAEIDYDELDRTYYPRARRRLRGTAFPDDLLAHPRYRSNGLWRDALEGSGLATEQVVSTYDFDVVRAELDGTATPSVTVGQYFFTGCDSGAKLSVDRTYLARAEETGRTTVRPLHNVLDIAQRRDGKYLVTVERLDTAGTPQERIALTCDRLVVAAGGVHTPRLLVTARETGALPDLNAAVGRQWGTNGDQLPIIRTNDEPTGAPQAGPPNVLARNGDGDMLVTHGGLPFPFETQLLLCAGVGVSDRFGHWSYSASEKRTRLNWEPSNDATAQRAVTDLLRPIKAQLPSGAKSVNPTAVYPLILHPLGGAAIGKATDEYGRLHGYRGLYCLDSALMPGSTGAANPVLTITAIVERCLDHLMDEFTA